MIKTKPLISKLRNVALHCLFLGFLAVVQPAPASQVWNYLLLQGSELVDSCPVCGRPDILVPVEGGFQLRLIQENPLVSTYAVEDIALVGGTPGGNYYKITGQGTCQVGGEVAVLQDWSLELQIDNGFTNTLCYFTNDTRTLTRLWPMIAIGLSQTNGTELQEFHLYLAAAPLREIWFSTLRPFHAGTMQSPTNYVSAGDLLSSSGRILRRNADLSRNLGIMPIVPDLGLKDMDILPGGEVAFSIDQNIFSESLGPLTPGDLLTDRGRILATNGKLISAFVPQPPVQNEGLNAVQVLDSGEIYFSVQTNFFSEALGQEVGHGDLLSSRGVILRKNQSLLAGFGPADPKQDYGLQAVYVWPSGEVWFSVQTGFTDTNSTQYLAGDLLSDQGYVVYRNLSLLSSFAPLEDLNNFGLDALFVVTDVTPPPTPPLCLQITVPPGTKDVNLRYKGQGRAFQLLKTGNLPGPWLPASPIGLDLEFTDSGALNGPAQGFYQLRAW